MLLNDASDLLQLNYIFMNNFPYTAITVDTLMAIKLATPGRKINNIILLIVRVQHSMKKTNL